MVRIDRVTDGSDDALPWIIAALLGGVVIGFLLLRWIESQSKTPMPDVNFNAPQTPYYSPYPYSPYPQQPAPYNMNDITTENAENWSVQRDVEGNITGIDVHRKVHEY